jgi:hypothetical protein
MQHMFDLTAIHERVRLTIIVENDVYLAGIYLLDSLDKIVQFFLVVTVQVTITAVGVIPSFCISSHHSEVCNTIPRQ